METTISTDLGLDVFISKIEKENSKRRERERAYLFLNVTVILMPSTK